FTSPYRRAAACSVKKWLNEVRGTNTVHSSPINPLSPGSVIAFCNLPNDNGAFPASYVLPCQSGQVNELMLNNVPLLEAMVIKPTPSIVNEKLEPNAPLKATFAGEERATRAVLPVVVPFTVRV